MSLFKALKEMREAVNSSQELNAHREHRGQVDTGMAQSPPAAARTEERVEPESTAFETAHPDFSPIAGVSLETYAAISKGLAQHNHDQSKAAGVALAHGVDLASWNQALAGWNERLRENPAVGRRFHDLYSQAR